MAQLNHLMQQTRSGRAAPAEEEEEERWLLQGCIRSCHSRGFRDSDDILAGCLRISSIPEPPRLQRRNAAPASLPCGSEGRCGSDEGHQNHVAHFALAWPRALQPSWILSGAARQPEALRPQLPNRRRHSRRLADVEQTELLGTLLPARRLLALELVGADCAQTGGPGVFPSES